jgi:hypothetical protein
MPFGPAFVSSGWNNPEGEMPELVTVVVTRQLPDGSLLPGTALTDRTCLGVKNGFVHQPCSRAALQELIDEFGAAHGGIEEVDVATALSIVHHAIDYARTLGFEPHPDFPAPLFGPRPEPLLDTPYGRPSRPIYLPGPEDDVAAIMQRLQALLGKEGAAVALPKNLLDVVDDAADDGDE